MALVLARFVLCLSGLQLILAADHLSYVVAVYEHRVLLNPNPGVPLDRRSALEHMKQNLRVFEEQTALAAQQGAQIIVFPEDAIHGFNFTRASITGYLETVPDPQKVTWSPCADPLRFPDTEVLHSLSCMARKNRLFLVANMPTRQSCNRISDPRCPEDSQYQFNTNVVFSDEGVIVARYHKQNLYFEVAFDAPPECKYITFTTPFAGRFGVFTCFDILFRDPAVTLVKEMGIRQIVYPTAWMNQLPLLAAVQFQSSFSHATGVTLLAANVRAAEYGITGSGIFTPWDSLIHHDTEGNSGKLLVRRVPVLDPSFIGNDRHKLVPFSGYQSSKEPEKMHVWPTISFNTNHDGKYCRKDSECAEGTSSTTFNSIMMYDNFTLVPLQGTEGNISICSGSVCCHLLFRRSDAHEFYALGVFDGLHVVHGTYYLEICALVRCTGEHHSSCGGETEHAQTLVDFRLAGTFTTTHVFPGILGSGMTLDVPDHSGWEGGNGFYMSRTGMSAGLVTAVLYGRHYEKDKA
ncbi:biotinidase [Sinocyclocheilus anshuiensis]|uniref:Biotinidase n=1 Tax=Sinocyclocheilus anshuiensis TaxID=1608454 RepID=A0A671KGC6_9TELE|nr:PREDICTED: biotinidase [Sinocyclocheilus anshuiensis]XP_016349926.1 PREDICTED: biotinidase [Sinocyclocheilus anshuiensis]